jgi:hypothetical protein
MVPFLIFALARSVIPLPAGYGRRFVVRSDEKLSAFVELERQVLSVTFYLESIQ